MPDSCSLAHTAHSWCVQELTEQHPSAGNLSEGEMVARAALPTSLHSLRLINEDINIGGSGELRCLRRKTGQRCGSNTFKLDVVRRCADSALGISRMASEQLADVRCRCERGTVG